MQGWKRQELHFNPLLGPVLPAHDVFREANRVQQSNQLVAIQFPAPSASATPIRNLLQQYSMSMLHCYINCPRHCRRQHQVLDVALVAATGHHNPRIRVGLDFSDLRQCHAGIERGWLGLRAQKQTNWDQKQITCLGS